MWRWPSFSWWNNSSTNRIESSTSFIADGRVVFSVVFPCCPLVSGWCFMWWWLSLSGRNKSATNRIEFSTSFIADGMVYHVVLRCCAAVPFLRSPLPLARWDYSQAKRIEGSFHRDQPSTKWVKAALLRPPGCSRPVYLALVHSSQDSIFTSPPSSLILQFSGRFFPVLSSVAQLIVEGGCELEISELRVLIFLVSEPTVADCTVNNGVCFSVLNTDNLYIVNK